MACERQTNKIAGLVCRLNTGISQLSSKQAFYAGVGVGVSAAGLAAMLVASRQRLATFFRRGGQPASPRQAISLVSTGSARPKPKPIPALGGQPTASKAKPIPGLAKSSGQPSPKPIPTLTGPSSSPVQTRLKATSIAVRTVDGQATQADGYELVRSDGSATGLALTPYLGQKNGQATSGGWGVTHLSSGALVDGPYDNVTQAQGLADRLAPLHWTATSLPGADVAQAKQIISTYRQSLAGTG